MITEAIETGRLGCERRVRSILARRCVKRVHQSRERDENVIRANACVFCCFACLAFLLQLVWFHACVSHSSFFSGLFALGHFFLVAHVAGCLALLAAGLFCAPGCFVGGSLIDGLGLGWFGLAVCSLLDWWFGSALLA